MTKNDMGSRALLVAAAGMEPDAVSAAMHVLNGGSILKSTPTSSEQRLGIDEIAQTLDANGDLLVAGANYSHRGKTVRLLREEIGGGNALDTFSRLYFLNSKLEEDHTVVGANYPNGMLSGPVYQSRLTPVD